jgi:hypothetical protein
MIGPHGSGTTETPEGKRVNTPICSDTVFTLPTLSPRHETLRLTRPLSSLSTPFLCILGPHSYSQTKWYLTIAPISMPSMLS